MTRNADQFITEAQADVGGVNLDDLDAANKSMFNLVANSKAKVMLRAEKKQTIERQHQKLSAQTRIEEHNLEQRWQEEKQNYLPQKPKVLGARAKTDFSKFEFEDDTGEQRANNEEYDRIVQGLEEQSSQLVQNAAFQSFIINQQIKQIDRMGTKVSFALESCRIFSTERILTKNRLKPPTMWFRRIGSVLTPSTTSAELVEIWASSVSWSWSWDLIIDDFYGRFVGHIQSRLYVDLGYRLSTVFCYASVWEACLASASIEVIIFAILTSRFETVLSGV
jgi:hypothetical protein